MKTISYPKIGKTKEQKVFVSFYINNKRYRLFNGNRIEQQIEPNSFPIEQREAQAKLLAAEIYKHLCSGKVFKEYRKEKVLTGNNSELTLLKQALKVKLYSDFTTKYKEELKLAYSLLVSNISNDSIQREDIDNTMNHYKNRSSYNTLRKNLNSLFNQALELGLKDNPMRHIKRLRTKANLNKPFDDVRLILDEIRDFNFNLYLCCILTYGCLLRPHREVRELTWGDFSQDLTIIKLAGSRNKSGRNRIVPVPQYVQEVLAKGKPNNNIFSGTTKPLNPGYFKTLWGRFKKVSKLLEQDQTLYSFRHSGAINIYKRTGSLSKLQKAMGHSNMMVSMTYLRGLEISELEESDMPKI